MCASSAVSSREAKKKNDQNSTFKGLPCLWRKKANLIYSNERGDDGAISDVSSRRNWFPSPSIVRGDHKHKLFFLARCSSSVSLKLFGQQFLSFWFIYSCTLIASASAVPALRPVICQARIFCSKWKIWNRRRGRKVKRFSSLLLWMLSVQRDAFIWWIKYEAT